jgi:uncharacterized protein (DUF3084 family)
LWLSAACPCCTQTPEGQPPDIWRRLPQEALQTALQYYKDAPNYDWDSNGALRSMARAAAAYSLGLEPKLQEEVAGLQATVAGLERRLQQRDKQLEQQDKRLQQQEKQLQQQEKQLQAFAGLQATVAGMGAQLQALLPQNSMQQRVLGTME